MHKDDSIFAGMRRWVARIDRERITLFFRFLLKRFVDDRCFESAGALAYTTMFALVPFSAVVFAVLSAFPVFDIWSVKLSEFIFANFVPVSARAVEQYLRDFSHSARELTGTGVAALLASILLTMWSIEQAFNRIWRVPSTRPKLTRFVMYWTLLTLGSLLMVAALAATSAFFSIPSLAGVEASGLAERLLRYLPVALELIAFTAAYWFIPHRTIQLRFALIGGLLATLLFEWLKWGLAIYLRNASFEQLYGAMAVIPIFLIWVYTSWLVVLLGASLAASLASFRYQPRALRLSPGAELYAVMRLLGRFEEARRDGLGLHLTQIKQREPSLTDELLQRMISSLCEMNILQRGESGAWLLSRDLQAVSMGELYEGLALRIPTGELLLPSRQDAIGRAANAALDHLRLPLMSPLERCVGSFFTHHPSKDIEQ
ncbi:MAG: YihY family inner membrane protein [Arenimonas sp.]|jgi:membrane protein